MTIFARSVRAHINQAEIALALGKINLAICIVHDFIERIITEPLCTAQAFASRDLDQMCLAIGRQNLKNLGRPLKTPGQISSIRPLAIYVVSRWQRSGGHSRLVQDFIGAQPAKDHLILSTEIGGFSDADYLLEHFAAGDNVRFVQAPRGNFQSKLSWLQAILLARQPEHIHLLNHHQDSVAVAAVIPELGLCGSFYHHGDHHLCLGVHMSHLTHVDLHPMGYHYCRDELGVNNRYLPLTFEDKYCMPVQTKPIHSGRITTATAARSNKVEIPYYVSYMDTIPSVLKATGGKHIHIGKLTPWALHRIYDLMRKLGIQKDRFVYIEWTPSVWQSLNENKVDVYLASFPYGAGLTLIEAMGAGIPVIMHQHMHSRVLSGLELAYPEAFRWSEPKDLLVYLASLRPEELEYEKALSRLRYEKFHRSEILQAYFKDPDSLQLVVPPLVSEFKPRYDEWAAWAETQLNFSRLLYRFSYRTWRRLRRLVS